MSDWVLVALVVGAVLFAILKKGKRPPPLRPFSHCPSCGEPSDAFGDECEDCGLVLNSRLARELYRVRVAEREVRGLVTDGALDRAAADPILEQLDARARRLRGIPARRGVIPRARPVPPAPPLLTSPLAPPDETEPPVPATAPARAVLRPAERPSEAPAEPARPASAALFPPAPEAVLEPGVARDEPTAAVAAPPREEPTPPYRSARRPAPPPMRRLSSFLEAHNILWGELVGGLLIVGCSIALVVTLRQTLEAIPYFRFLLSAAVTLALFGAGQYTLHRWKLSGTSRGMLVISLLLAPLTLLLLAAPFTEGTGGALDIAVKVAAVAAFVGVVRTGGRDLIGTEHLPGPIDRRWLLALAVVGATATQLLPDWSVAGWLPLACFVLACGATLGGLSWYHPARRAEPVREKTGTALLMFVGLAAFALLAAWGLYLVRAPADVAARLNALAVPLALAAVPVVEAGVLVYRRVTSSGLRTFGTAVALIGFVAMTAALALAWPDPLAVFLVALAAGLFLTRVSFRERLAWAQGGAIPLLSVAVALGFQGAAGNWPVTAGLDARAWLGARLGSAESGAALAGFALVLGVIAELLARRGSAQATAYALGATGVGTVGLLLVSWHGVEQPALAALTHAACALALLASNARWKLRAVAHSSLYLALVATLWALWWLAPRMPDRWGFVVASEALVLATGAVALRGTHGPATALLRRAARDVAFAAWLLAVALAVTSLTLGSEWHTGTLFALAVAAVALARLTGWAPLTWVGSTAALLGFAHLNVYALRIVPEQLAVEAGILTHATLATLAALACRRQARVFGDPLRWAARLSSALAVPLLLVPPAGHAFATAVLAVWLGGLWLCFVLLWRERGGFTAFQGAITLAALLTAFGWVERQTWWSATAPAFDDPRALHAFGLALVFLALVWVGARRAVLASPRARELWSDHAVSLDRVTLAFVVVAFVGLTALAVVPGARAELTPAVWSAPVVLSPAFAHAFGPAASWLLGLLALAVVLSWRLTKLDRDTDPHALGLALLVLAVPVVWAGGHAVDVAAASALRWGLAVAFVLGSAAVAARVPLRRLALAGGFPVRPSPALRPWLLGLFAVAAGVVVLISALVAELGLSRLKPSGPVEGSVFAQMGTMAANLVPLALVILGLGATAGRERSSGYALAGGLVFVATLTAGYALAVITAGKPLDGAEQVRVVLVAATSAAVWALLWLAVERRVPGGVPLGAQTCLGFAALGTVALVAGGRVITFASEPLPEAFAPLSQFGWFALVAVAGAGFWHARRVWPEGVSLPLAFAGVVAGVLLAASVRTWDEPDRWLSFHALALAWAAGGLLLFANLRRGGVIGPWLGVFAALLVVCALRAGWSDPWRPWLPAGLSLAAGLFLGGIALRARSSTVVAVSCVAVDLAAVFVWIAWGPDTLTGFALANAAGFAVAAGAWSVVRVWRFSHGKRGPLGHVPDLATAVAILLLTLGLMPAFTHEHVAPGGLVWGALGAVALACAVGVWDRAASLARPGLFACGVLAVLLGVASADPRPVWEVPTTSLALAGFVFAVAWLALAVSRLASPVLRMPERGDPWKLFVVGESLVAGAVVLFGLHTGLTAAELWERLLNPASVVLLALAAVVLVQAVPDVARGALRTTVIALGVLALGAVAWSAPDPLDRFAWLHRNGWLFVALVAAAVVGTELASRMREDWHSAAKSVLGWVVAGAFVVLCVNLIQQVPVYNPAPDVRRTPLSREVSLAMLVAIAGLFVLALRFALKPDRDPFALPPRRRTAYVYGAEVLIVLFFTQVRFNVPELFLGELAKLWTFAVMALAYVGIGLSELLERKKIDVLALPLRRTGVLLPLVPLIAFWAKPPAFVSEFAQTAAPGLGPLLGYLEKLPQHFDTYAWLWFLAGGVYALVALSRKSFGWALLAALATNAAMWSLLAHTGVPFIVHPQAWVIPLALIVLASEHINRHRLRPDVSNAMRYGGIAMIYVASAADMFIAGVGNSMWLPVVLAVLCVAGVLTGILLRVRAFLYLGVGFLMLDIFAMIWHAAVNLEQTWVWYASGIVLGVAVLALFAFLEKRRTHAKEPEPAERDPAGE